MKIRKVLVFVLFIFVLVLSGCGGESSPEKLWNNYIKAMNTKNIETVASIYYAKESNDYKKFVETKNLDEYFNFDKLKTKQFTPSIENERYYSAEVKLEVDGYESTFDVYFIRDVGGPWRFISEVDPIAMDYENLGNKPNDNFYNNIILSNNEFDYKYYFGTKPGVIGDNDYVKIVYPNSNSRVINIPNNIDGAPVTIIGDFAFFDYFRIFSVTFSKSKLQEINLPDTLQVIDSYAFYQTKNLKQIVLPSSLKEVKNYAFASSGIEKLVINVDDTTAYEKLTPKKGVDTMSIVGDKIVFIGDTPSYSVLGYAANQISWSTSNSEVATIAANGRLTLVKAGTVDVIATLNTNSEIVSKATVEIKPTSEKIINSTVPSNPAFSNFKFSIKKTFFTTEDFSVNMSLPSNWSTNNTNVAVVEGNKVKMVGAGTVTITATAQANPDLKVSATVTVKDISEKNVQSTFSYDNYTFTGARDMFVGDYIKLVAPNFNESQIEWSSSNESLATVGRYSGVVTAKAIGSVTIKGTRVDNPNIVSMVTIQISDPVKGVVFSENALDRLNNLTEIYINAINPYSVDIKGTLKLRSDVKIYVPAQNIDTYKVKWGKFANNIYPMPQE